MKTVLVVGMGCMALLVVGTVARSQPAPGTTTAAPMEHKAMTPTEIKWGEPPPVFNKSAKFAVLAGDPNKHEFYAVRMKMPSGYKIMPHWHPTDEHVTVISGSFAIGMGDTMDMKTKPLPAGSFFAMPAK